MNILADVWVPLITSFLTALLLGRPVVAGLRAVGLQTFHWRKTDIDNSLFYDLHQKKIGTPSMGGVLMVGVSTVLVLVLVRAPWAGIFVACFLLFAVLGLADDLSKLLVKAGRAKRELAARPKFLVQWGLALLVGALLYGVLHLHRVSLPGGCVGCLDLSWGYIFLAAAVLVSATNAVNITDGLDGLAGGLLCLAVSALLVVALWRGQSEVALLAAVILGPILAFLFYNIHPAKVFMGDVGSMALGAALGMIALLGDNVTGLILVSGVFMVEALSSALQIAARRRGRRIFRIAPLHHHLEAVGWPETRITTVFWTAGLLCASLAVLVGRMT
ncbi:MAG: phospho-N-acetylmuramoyl-pentapeptide-transferase [Chloroflexota bacterium]